MAVSNGDVLKAFIELVLSDGTIAQNVFYFIANFLDDEGDYDVKTAIKGYIEDIYSAISTYLSDDFTINPSSVSTIVYNATEGKWEVNRLVGNITPSFTHTNTDDPFPNQIAPVLTANTLRPKSRGRKFLMGCVETMADASELVTAAVTAMGNALAVYLADETVSGSNVLSPGVPRAGVNTFLEFSDGSVNSIVGTQRRRKPGVGT
jgi:hypothetical protein